MTDHAKGAEKLLQVMRKTQPYNPEHQLPDVQVMKGHNLTLAEAEIDRQIATAHAYPRSVTKAVSAIQTLATLDSSTAGECLYALPARRGEGGNSNVIQGPSVRFAEIIGGQWGNCRIGSRIVKIDREEKYVEAEGIFHDLETNCASLSTVRRRISGKSGYLYNEDMILKTCDAACAIAKRNAILGGVPKAVWRPAFEAVERVTAGDLKTVASRREVALRTFAAMGISATQIFDALDIDGIDDITQAHLTTLTGMRAAIKSGEATVDEMFPKKPPEPAAKAEQALTVDPETGEITPDRPPLPDELWEDTEPSGQSMYDETGEIKESNDQR